MAGSLSTALKGCEIESSSACFLPISPDNLPIIGSLPDCHNIFIAAGHSCWGILNSPATGLCLAQLVATGRATSVDLSVFDPARFANMDKVAGV